MPDDIDERLEDVMSHVLGDVGLHRGFSPQFMQRYTEFEDLETFFEASPWSPETTPEFEAIPASELDEYVDERTVFVDWQSMYQQAERHRIRQA